MKKRVLWILILVCALSLCGCQTKEHTVTVTEQYVSGPPIVYEHAAYVLPQAPTERVSPNKVDCRILLYHDFSDTPPSEKRAGAVTTAQRFEQDICYILAQGYSIVPLYRLAEYAAGMYELPEKSVIITADDGYVSNYTHMYPILQKYKVHATIFVTVSTMGTDGKLTVEMMREMEQSGLVDIQSHSLAHRDQSTLTADRIIKETAVSFDLLENWLGEESCPMLAYPYGRYTEQSLTLVREQGAVMQLTTDWSALNMESIDLSALPRLTVSHFSDIGKLLNVPKK